MVGPAAQRLSVFIQRRPADIVNAQSDQHVVVPPVRGLDLAGQATIDPLGLSVRPSLGYEDISPISAPAPAALEAYLRQHPCLGEAPLFPAAKRPEQPMHKMDALYLFRRAEEKAGLVKLERGVWHPYRRLWAVERKHLPDVDVARAGGWRDLTTMKRSYQQADPVTTLQVVENRPMGHTLDTPQNQAAQPQ